MFFHYSVQVIEFNDKTFNNEYLDGWITYHVKESKGSFNSDGNIVFTDSRGQSLFWRSEHFYIKITFLRQSKSDTREINDKEVFPSELLNNYLELYPSDCYKTGCVTSVKSLCDLQNSFDEDFLNNIEHVFNKHNGFK